MARRDTYEAQQRIENITDNLELREMQEITTSIQDSMLNMVQHSHQIVNLWGDLTDIMSELEQNVNITENLIGLEERRVQLANENWGSQDGIRIQALGQLNIMKHQVRQEQIRRDIIQSVLDVSDGISQSFSSTIDSLSSMLSDIPVIGGMLSTLLPADALSESFDSMMDTFKTSFINGFSTAMNSGMTGSQSFFAGIRSGFSSVSSFIRGAAPVLFNPYVVAITGLVAVIGVAIAAFKRIDDAMGEFKESTGLLNSQIEGMDKMFVSIENKYSNIGVKIADVSKATSDFIKQFNGIIRPSEAVISSMTVLEKNFGVATEESAKLNDAFQNMGQLSAEQAQSLASSVVQLSAMSDIAPTEVVKEITENAGDMAMYMGKVNKNVGLSVIQIKKMGSSLNSALASTKSLLDFETSITSEQEASVLLGQSISFDKARIAAANKDIVGQERAILDELLKINDINELSPFQMESLARASGKTAEQLLRMVNIEKQFPNIDAERLKAANELLDAGKDLNDITDEDLRQQTERQTRFQNIENSLTSVGTKLLNAFLPLGEALMPMLETLTEIIGTVLSGLVPAIKLVATGLTYALKPIQYMATAFETVIEFVKEYYDYIIAAGVGAGTVYAWQQRIGIQTAINNGLSAIGAGWDRIKALWAERQLIMTRAGAIAETVWNGVRTAAVAIMSGGFWRMIAGMAMSAFTSLAAIPFVGPILGAAAAASAWALGKSYFSKAGDVLSPADGKTQISTKEGGLFELSKNDDVLAGPGLANKLNTKADVGISQQKNQPIININIDALIAEIRELRNDIKNNKVAVYLDGKKVMKELGIVASNSTTNYYGNRK